jgi:hypothetical protein
MVKYEMYERPVGTRQELINSTDAASNQTKRNRNGLSVITFILITHTSRQMKCCTLLIDKLTCNNFRESEAVYFNWWDVK